MAPQQREAALDSRLEEIEGWLARVALGDRPAFDALYSATSAKLFAVCLSVLADRAEAEEALQDTFLRIWHNAGRYAANGLSPMTWLITIARNRSIDRRRRTRKVVTGEGEEALMALADPAPGPEARLTARSEVVRIGECIEALDPPRAEALRGAYLRGLSYAELAARHDVPLNTMRSWLRRSLISLRECMGQ